MLSQYAVTGMGPIEGFKAHLADPTGVNIYASAVGGETVAFIAFLSSRARLVDAPKTIDR